MVRGYWGDITNSPYISYGVEVEKSEEYDHFYQNDSVTYRYDAKSITEYNLLKYLIQIEKDEVIYF
jgi:hypothetical protein